GVLHDRLVQVVTATLAGLAVSMATRGREDPLPRPFAAGRWRLAAERRRQRYPAGAPAHVVLVLGAHAIEMPRQRPAAGAGQYRDAVAIALAAAHDELGAREIDVLHAKP